MLWAIPVIQAISFFGGIVYALVAWIREPNDPEIEERGVDAVAVVAERMTRGNQHTLVVLLRLPCIVNLAGSRSEVNCRGLPGRDYLPDQSRPRRSRVRP